MTSYSSATFYTESGFSHTHRNSYFFDAALTTILDSVKFKSDGFFSCILTTTFQCSLCSDDAWNSNQHFPESPYLLNVPRLVCPSPHCVICSVFHTSCFKNKLNAPWFWPKTTTGRNLLHNGCFKNSFSCCKLHTSSQKPWSPVQNAMLLIFKGLNRWSTKFPGYTTELDTIRISGTFLYFLLLSSMFFCLRN